MKQLNRIQKRNNLNTVFVMDEEHPVNKGHHEYAIVLNGTETVQAPDRVVTIKFQNGPRNVEGSVRGILDTDLLEIERDRLAAFQSGPYATRENAIALTHIEEALLWMNKRVEDRAEAGTLGTNKV